MAKIFTVCPITPLRTSLQFPKMGNKFTLLSVGYLYRPRAASCLNKKRTLNKYSPVWYHDIFFNVLNPFFSFKKREKKKKRKAWKVLYCLHFLINQCQFRVWFFLLLKFDLCYMLWVAVFLCFFKKSILIFWRRNTKLWELFHVSKGRKLFLPTIEITWVTKTEFLLTLSM